MHYKSGENLTWTKKKFSPEQTWSERKRVWRQKRKRNRQNHTCRWETKTREGRTTSILLTQTIIMNRPSLLNEPLDMFKSANSTSVYVLQTLNCYILRVFFIILYLRVITKFWNGIQSLPHSNKRTKYSVSLYHSSFSIQKSVLPFSRSVCCRFVQNLMFYIPMKCYGLYEEYFRSSRIEREDSERRQDETNWHLVWSPLTWRRRRSKNRASKRQRYRKCVRVNERCLSEYVKREKKDVRSIVRRVGGKKVKVKWEQVSASIFILLLLAYYHYFSETLQLFLVTLIVILFWGRFYLLFVFCLFTHPKRKYLYRYCNFLL